MSFACKTETLGSLYIHALFITGRNKVVAKVTFLHLFVILFTGGMSEAAPREQTPPWSRHTTPEQTPPRSRHPQSRHPPPPGADTPGADTPPPPIFFFFNFFKKFFFNFFKFFFKFFFFLFSFLFFLGMPTLPYPKLTQAYGQRAAGTHPTGMHSCSN